MTQPRIISTQILRRTAPEQTCTLHISITEHIHEVPDDDFGSITILESNEANCKRCAPECLQDLIKPSQNVGIKEFAYRHRREGRRKRRDPQASSLHGKDDDAKRILGIIKQRKGFQLF